MKPLHLRWLLFCIFIDVFRRNTKVQAMVDMGYYDSHTMFPGNSYF